MTWRKLSINISQELHMFNTVPFSQHLLLYTDNLMLVRVFPFTSSPLYSEFSISFVLVWFHKLNYIVFKIFYWLREETSRVGSVLSNCYIPWSGQIIFSSCFLWWHECATHSLLDRSLLLYISMKASFIFSKEKWKNSCATYDKSSYRYHSPSIFWKSQDKISSLSWKRKPSHLSESGIWVVAISRFIYHSSMIDQFWKHRKI